MRAHKGAHAVKQVPRCANAFLLSQLGNSHSTRTRARTRTHARSLAPTHARSLARTHAPDVELLESVARSVEESKKQREFLSLRDAPSGSTRVQFRKPNQATTGLTLGLKFRESFGKAVYIDQILFDS